MPAREELPGTLRRSPRKARETWLETHDSAFKQLKRGWEKVDDHWERKNEPGPSDPRSRNRGRAAREGRGEALGGVDLFGHTRAELYERATRLGVRGRSAMTKLELALAIDRKQD